jgi:S-adenosylmethionine hydrolase
MKGVIAGIAPDARVIDLTHEVPAQDVQTGAFQLLTAHRYFPAGTIHVAVVDPGVGTERAIVAVRAGHHLFVGPDNGVLLWSVQAAGGPITGVRIENRQYALAQVSATFHGRDVMAPAAAHLAIGVPLESLGPPSAPLAGQRFPEPRDWWGVVVHVDRFGNCVTNLPPANAAALEVLGRRLPVASAYAAASAGQAVAVAGSAGFLEVAVNGGSAAARLGIARGTPVRALPV